MVNQLSRLELPVGDPGTRNPNTLRGAVDPLIEQVVAAGGDERSRFSEIIPALDAVLEGQEAAYRENVNRIITASEEAQVLRRRGARTDKPDRALVSAETLPFAKQAAQLKVGDHLMFSTRSGGGKRVTLAWRGDDDGPFDFVDPMGNNAGSLSVDQLARQLASGSASIEEKSDLSAIDRSWFQVLHGLHQDLAFEATHDALTGLANQKAFSADVEQALAGARREQTQHVVCVLELDQLDTIDAECGDAAGDNLLKKIARVLKKHVSGRGSVARCAANRFAALLENRTLEEGRQFAERQRHAIEQSRCVWQGRSFSLSMSAGVALVTESDPSAGVPVEAAMSACAEARKAGGNCVRAPGEESVAPPAARTTTKSGVEQILGDERMALLCQRIEPLGDENGIKPQFEILLGVRDEQGGLLSPYEFIQAAEREGRMPAVDRWVVRTAFEWLSKNRAKLLDAGGYSINLSGSTLSDARFIEYVIEQLNATSVPPGRVLFEITEAAAISSLSVAVDFIRTLKEYGCRFSLDDFGTGRASFSYLKTLPLDYLKIDGMFVKDIIENPNDLAVVRSINEIGHFMGKETVAEFVESDAILAQIREIGVDFAQGFAIERPFLLTSPSRKS